MIHNYWLKTCQIDAVYDRAAVPPGMFPLFAATIGLDGLHGANVTLPYKETAFGLCDRRTGAAEAMGAVNTLWREGAALCGDNTDAQGLIGSFDDEIRGWRRHVGSAVVLGAGGAARATIYALIGAGLERIVIVNRTLSRAQSLATVFGAKVSASTWYDLPEQLARVDLLVNTTSLGMAGQPDLYFDVEMLKVDTIVVDLVYVPLDTTLVGSARARGLRAFGGLGMLLHQAAPAFEQWFGVAPAITHELRDLVASDILAQGSEKR